MSDDNGPATVPIVECREAQVTHIASDLWRGILDGLDWLGRELGLFGVATFALATLSIIIGTR